MKRKIPTIDIFLLLLINIIFFFKILFVNRFLLAISEILSESFQFHVRIGELLRNGQFPIWDPYVYFAFPSLSFTAAYYPPALLMSFLGSFLDLDKSFLLMQLLMVVHVYLASVFMYVFLSGLKLSRKGIWLGVISFSYGCVVIAGTRHASMLYTYIWLPLFFHFFMKALNELNYKKAVFAGCTLAMTLFAGYTPYVFYMCFFLLLYILWLVIGEINNQRRFSFGYLFKLSSIGSVIFLSGSGLAAVFVLPLLEYGSLSIRNGQTYNIITMWGAVNPLHFITLIFPHFFGGAHTQHWGGNLTSSLGWWEMVYYVGIGTLAMAILSILFDYEAEIKKIHKFLIFISVLTGFFMMGRLSSALGMLYAMRIIPVTRVTSRWAFFLVFSLSTLAAIGFNAMCHNLSISVKENLKKLFYSILFPLTSILFLGTILLLFVLLRFGLIQSIRSLVHFWIFYSVTIAFVYYRVRKNHPGICVIFLLFCVLDIWLASYRVYPISLDVPQVLPSKYFRDNALVEFLNNDKSIYRVSNLPWPIIGGVLNKVFTLGYDAGTAYKRLAEFRKETDPMGSGGHDWFSLRPDVHSQLVDFYNIKYLISASPLDEMDAKYERIAPYFYKNKAVFERAFCVFDYEVIKDAESILSRIENIDLTRTVILEEEPMFIKHNVKDEDIKAAAAKIVNYQPCEVDIETDIDIPSILVLSDIWYPGWKAFIDGQSVKICRANYVFRAVELSGGKHNIKFKYDSISIKIGLGISCITALFLMVYFISLRRKK